MVKHSGSRSSAVSGVLLLLTCVGCGTGAYEKRLEARVKELRRGSAFQQLDAAKDIPGTPIRVRVLPVFKEPLVEGAVIDGVKVDAQRVKPPLVTLVGLKVTYEAFITDSEGGKMPYYCYLSVTPAGPKERDPSRFWTMQLKERLPQSDPKWEPVQVPTPEGGMIDWQRLRVTGDQEFYYVDKPGKGSPVTMPGTLVLYLRQEGGFYVTIGWRLPTGIEANVELDKLEKLVAGTLTVKEATE